MLRVNQPHLEFVDGAVRASVPNPAAIKDFFKLRPLVKGGDGGMVTQERLSGIQMGEDGLKMRFTQRLIMLCPERGIFPIARPRRRNPRPLNPGHNQEISLCQRSRLEHRAFISVQNLMTFGRHRAGNPICLSLKWMIGAVTPDMNHCHRINTLTLKSFFNRRARQERREKEKERKRNSQPRTSRPRSLRLNRL